MHPVRQNVQTIESVETLQGVGVQISANETHVIVGFVCPNQARTIQIPFERLLFVQFVAECQKAIERDPVSNGGDPRD